MRRLNRQWRGKDKTTDVLSFSYREGPHAIIQPQVMGDIVISVPQAERQAVAAGIPVGKEIERLLVHGFVHLLGYDHERGELDSARMKRKERQLLRGIAG